MPTKQKQTAPRNVRLLSPIHNAIQRMIREFEGAEDDSDLAKPAEPVSFDEVFGPLIESGAYEEDDDRLEFPWSLPEERLVSIEWSSGPGFSSSVSYYAVTLPTGVRLYVEFQQSFLGFRS